MIRIREGIVALIRDGEIIIFENREEYDDWIKTDECNNASNIYASPEFLIDDLRKFSLSNCYFRQIQDDDLLITDSDILEILSEYEKRYKELFGEGE